MLRDPGRPCITKQVYCTGVRHVNCFIKWCVTIAHALFKRDVLIASGNNRFLSGITAIVCCPE